MTQTVASFLGQSLPVIAPLIIAAAGWPPERMGPLSSLVAFGTVLFLLCGGAVLARLGPVRTLQAGAVLQALGMAALASGTLPGLMLAGLLLGLGYGPSPPAGSRILAAAAPARHRTLIFSVKQAGAPLGGVLAGLISAPVAAWAGWPAAVLLALAVSLGTAAIVQPVRAALDAERDPARPLGPRALLAPGALAAPFRALRLDPLLPPLSALAVAFAMVQGSLFSFTVTWLVEARGFSLVQAGSVFAAMQAAGIAARIALGWLADRTGRALPNLVAQAFAAAAFLVALGIHAPGTAPWQVAALGALAAAAGAGWNGVVLAEVARLCPLERVAEATAGSTLVIFLGYAAGPSLFAAVLARAGWEEAFLALAAQLALVGGAVGLLLARAGPPRGRAAGR
nr:MFS transporter [Caldovatus aquaticus]